MINFEIADLPLSILDRARATAATTADDLLSLDVHRERAWVAHPILVEYVVPLT